MLSCITAVLKAFILEPFNLPLVNSSTLFYNKMKWFWPIIVIN